MSNIKSPFCPKFEGGECNILEIARHLCQQIERTGPASVQDGSQPDGLYHAQVRHECTNYDDVICELPMCGAPLDENEESEECWERREARRLIKKAASPW